MDKKKIGRNDFDGTPIYTGDTLKNRHNGLTYKVGADGALWYRDMKTTSWNESDYLISDEEEAKPAKESQEAAMPEAPKEELKRCPRCGRELPRSQFYSNGYCRECGNAKAKEYSARRKAKEDKSVKTEVLPMPEPATNGISLSQFSDGELAAELRSRGYELSATKTTIVTL